jgi:H+/Na+-translocating ferredoxin:NAD+ oxidoreductase subunit G
MSAEAGTLKTMAGAALVLTLFASVAAGLLGLTEAATREQIAASHAAALLAGLYEVIPQSRFDNELILDVTTITAPRALGSPMPVTVYRARLGGVPVAAAFEVIAPDGYSGAIKLLIGVDYAGLVTGVRTLSHRETPGLGDAIDIQRSDWVLDFDGRSLDAPLADAWAVRRDGGSFDQFTGATITPRAVVNAIRRALFHFREHRDTYFATESERVE